MKYATGKDSKVGHSTGTHYDDVKTGTHYDDVKKMRKKYTPVKHSTGSDTSIKHTTGIEFERRAAEEMEEEQD